MPAYRLFNTWRSYVSDKETYIEILRALQVREPRLFDFLAKTCPTSKRTFFSRTPEGLFPGSPHLADTRAHYSQIVPGWYADMNLSNRQKERVLIYACAGAGIEYLRDLEVRFDLNHYSPMSARESAEMADRLLAELLSL